MTVASELNPQNSLNCRLNLVPEGHLRIAQCFSFGREVHERYKSPKGTVDKDEAQFSRPFGTCGFLNVETQS